MNVWMIRDHGDLRRLLVTKHQNFSLALPTLSADDNLALERRLRRHYSGCGCGEGAVGMLGGFLLAAVVWVVAPPFGWPGNILASIGAGTVLSGLGKSFGLWRSQRALGALVSSIERNQPEHAGR